MFRIVDLTLTVNSRGGLAMLLQRIAVVPVLTMLVLASLAACSKDQPTEEITGPDLSRSIKSTGTKYVVSTPQELLDAFNDAVSPALADGDTVYVLSGTYTLTTQQLVQAGNKSLYFIGQTPTRPLIKRTNGSVGTYMVTFDDSSPGNHRLVVKDLRFEESSSATGLAFSITNYRRVDIANVDVTTAASTPHVYVRCDTLNISSVNMVGNGVLLSHYNRDGVSGVHTVQDCVFDQVGTGYNTVGTRAETSGATSTFNYEGNAFEFEQNSPGFGVAEFDGTGGTSYYLVAVLTDNEFGNRRVDLKGSGDITRVIYYDGNVQNHDQCVEDVISPPAEISFLQTWVYNGNLYSYEAFGGFSNLNAFVTYMEGPAELTAFVEFSLALGTGNDNQEIVEVAVRHGDSSCDSEITSACYNSATGKWNAQFVIDSYASPFYWKPEATICDVTHVGTCTAKTFKPPYPSPGTPPNWYDCD
jgi:hypothetical protein